MNRPSKLGMLLRNIAVIALGLTAVFHLLGGIGTTCVALGAEKYPSMAGIVPYKWLYQLFVLVTLGISVLAIRATIRLARAKAGAYRQALFILFAGMVVTGIHVLVSKNLRGSAVPNDVRLYLNVLTLVIFLVFRLPGVWQKMDFDNPKGRTDGSAGAGVALILAGITSLTIHLWAAPSHTWEGINYADLWHRQLSITGWGMVIAGGGLLLWRLLGLERHKLLILPAMVKRKKQDLSV